MCTVRGCVESQFKHSGASREQPTDCTVAAEEGVCCFRKLLAGRWGRVGGHGRHAGRSQTAGVVFALFFSPEVDFVTPIATK